MALTANIIDFVKKKVCMHTIINPFSRTGQRILKMPSNIQMEVIDLKVNSVLKMKFDDISSLTNVPELIYFWRSLSCEHLTEQKIFAQSNACHF